MSGSTSFPWIGNHPATDLCNTTPVIDGRTVDLLANVADLGHWLPRSGVGTRVAIEGLSHREQRTALVRTRDLRDALRPVLEDRSGSAPLATLNEALAACSAVLTISARPPHVLLTADGPAAQLRLDVAAAVTDIFNHDRNRLRRCANPACVLLFLDTSKGGRRRWCDMSTCGNRAKAANHYQRHHTGRRTATDTEHCALPAVEDASAARCHAVGDANVAGGLRRWTRGDRGLR